MPFCRRLSALAMLVASESFEERLGVQGFGCICIWVVLEMRVPL